MIVAHPERVKNDRRFRKLCTTHSFASRLAGVVIDEAHCVSDWASFRPEYTKIGELRWLLPAGIPFYATSATITPKMLGEIQRSLHMRPDQTDVIRLSNDRTNMRYEVRQMKHHANSFLDLAFLIPFGLAADSMPPAQFMVFTNSRHTCEGAAKYLRSRLPLELCNKVVWFHAGMTEEFKRETVEKLKRGEIWGICCTDAAGLVSQASPVWELYS